jgi:cytosine/adenosine deaminase-related metal-dependent hydrolase/ubiquinone/menaquinone biosynthesis C-methylase UbiE
MSPSISAEPSATLFDRWAEVYDAGSNPLLMLEEQMLPPLLPSIEGRHVLDVGCGTGRWLAHLDALQPASLIGTDSSAAMLRRARAKTATARLLRSDASTHPVPDGSQDLILSSFVLSYLNDLPAFAAECARALKPGGWLLVSDMHPDTALERKWTRTFVSAGQTVRIAVAPPSLLQMLALFSDAGLEICQLREPSFQPEQRELFAQAGRLADFQDLEDVPAIYLLKLRKPLRPIPRGRSTSSTTIRLTNTRWSIGPSSWCDTPLAVERGVIAAHRSNSGSNAIDLTGYVVLPGLINAHDHLEFALFPNLGRQPGEPPYANSTEWAHEIHHRHAAIIADHGQVPLEARVWWGAIRNLLCGVTTVCHHNRIHPELFHPRFPVRIVDQLGWGHSLAFEPHLAERFRAADPDQPFMLHAGEGTDASSHAELAALDALGLLHPRTVLVHGLAFTPQDVALINRRGAALVLCPTSNRYLFARTPANSFIHSIHRVALGSDSPLTAAGDLLDEVRHLRVEQDLDPHTLFNLTTASPAALLQLRRGEGHILPGGRADLIAVRDEVAPHRSPSDTLAHLTPAEVELVMLGGQVQLASPAIRARLSEEQRSGLCLLEVAGMERWVRAPLPALFHCAEQFLGRGHLRLGGKPVRHRYAD